jgi:hypothetical protein
MRCIPPILKGARDDFPAPLFFDPTQKILPGAIERILGFTALFRAQCVGLNFYLTYAIKICGALCRKGEGCHVSPSNRS